MLNSDNRFEVKSDECARSDITKYQDNNQWIWRDLLKFSTGRNVCVCVCARSRKRAPAKHLLKFDVISNVNITQINKSKPSIFVICCWLNIGIWLPKSVYARLRFRLLCSLMNFCFISAFCLNRVLLIGTNETFTWYRLLLNKLRNICILCFVVFSSHSFYL